MLLNAYVPSRPEVVTSLLFVSELEAITCTRATTAPVGSMTTPAMVPVPAGCCAWRLMTVNGAMTAAVIRAAASQVRPAARERLTNGSRIDFTRDSRCEVVAMGMAGWGLNIRARSSRCAAADVREFMREDCATARRRPRGCIVRKQDHGPQDAGHKRSADVRAREDR